MEAKKIEIKTLFLCLATVLSVEVALRLVISKGLGQPMVLLGAARLLETILITLLFLISEKGLTSIGLNRSQFVPGLKKGLIWSAGFGLVACFGFAAMIFLRINPLTYVRTPLPRNPNEIALFFLVGGVVAPVAEEVFFRGVLYGFFKRWGVIVAIVLTTVIFVLIHTMNGGFPVTQVVGGIVFALAYEMTGSLMVPITIHALGNTAIFTLSLIF